MSYGIVSLSVTDRRLGLEKWHRKTRRNQAVQSCRRDPTLQCSLSPNPTSNTPLGTVHLASNFIMSRIFKGHSTSITLSKLIKQTRRQKTRNCLIQVSGTCFWIIWAEKTKNKKNPVKLKSPSGCIFHQTQEELFGS